MAQVTANFSLNSSDLIPSQALSMTASKTLYKADSAAEWVDELDLGRVEIPTGTNFDLIDATALGADKRNYIYIANHTTTESNYVVVTCNDEEIGRLYAGDFMWLPASFSNAADDIEVRAFVGTATVEFAVFHEGRTLTTAS